MRTPIDPNDKLILHDYPTAWKIMAATDPEQHHERCSYRQSKRGVLCDCAASQAFIATVRLVNEFVSSSSNPIP